MSEVKFIKFMRCPIEFHRGERWSKLSLIDPGEPFKLVAMTYAWSDDFFTKGVCFDEYGHGVYQMGDFVDFDAKNDTFADMTLEKWRELMNYWYEDDNIFGLVLLFSQKCKIGDPIWFTTFRCYNPKHALYYRESTGQDFMLKEVV